MSDKAKEILSSIFGYLVIVLLCCLYVLTAIFILNPTGKTLWQIIADGVMALGMGIILDHLFRQQGIINGMKSDQFSKTKLLYGKTVEKINDNINLLSSWCFQKNIQTYKEQRTKILSKVGLRYGDCFYNDGTAKPFNLTYEKIPIIVDEEKLKDKNQKKIEKAKIKTIKNKNREAKKDYRCKRKCYWQAVKLKLSELYANDLTSEGGKREDPNYLGETIAQYVTIDSIQTWVSKIFFALFFGIYGITLIQDFSLFELLYRAFQILLFCVLGLVKMRKSKMFITENYRGRILKKMNNLEEFFIDIQDKNNQEQVVKEQSVEEVKGEDDNGKRGEDTSESI